MFLMKKYQHKTHSLNPQDTSLSPGLLSLNCAIHHPLPFVPSCRLGFVIAYLVVVTHIYPRPSYPSCPCSHHVKHRLRRFDICPSLLHLLMRVLSSLPGYPTQLSSSQRIAIALGGRDWPSGQHPRGSLYSQSTINT